MAARLSKPLKKERQFMKNTLFSAFMLSLLCLTGCTYSITMVHTEGTASDVVDEADTPSLTASIPVSGSTIPAVPVVPATLAK